MSLEDLIATRERLGEGGFGSVFVCELGRKKVAAKKLSQSEKEFENLIRETSRLKRLEHGKHIAYTYGFTLKEESLYMVMEYSELGDLQKYLKRNKDSVTYEQKILFCRGILLGLLYCHSMKVFHGDIKCSNVILGKNLEPKLTDFGLSMSVDDIEGYCKIYEGSIHWTAPELFSMEEEGNFVEFKANPYPTDVYSLGATFCQVSFSGTTEFIDSDNIEMDISLGFASPIAKDGFLEEIVDGCCQFERNERISLDVCLSMLDVVTEELLLIPAIDEKWQEMQQDIKTNSKLKLPPAFILHRPKENLVVGPSNLSLLEWLCINKCVDAVEYIIQPNEYGQYDQSQIKWLCGISELCKSRKTVKFLQSLMQDTEFSFLKLSNLIDNYPQQFIEMLIEAGASNFSYNLLKKAIEKCHNMTVRTVISSRDHFKDWAVHDAIKFGNAEAVKILANAGANLEWKDDRIDYTPLEIAIETENIEIVKILLGLGTFVNKTKRYSLHSREAEELYKYFRLAALRGNREVAKLLINAGAAANITDNEWDSLSQSLEEQGNFSMARFIYNSISKWSSPVENSSLCAAIRNKKSDLVQTLVNVNGNVDGICFDGYAPLHWAVIVGDEEIIRILIRAGADLDIRTSKKAQNLQSTSSPDHFSECTPLHIAVAKGYLSISKLLIESGADFSAKNGLQQRIMNIAKEDRKPLEKIIRECTPINVISVRRVMKSLSLESIKRIISNQHSNTEILSEFLCTAVKSGKNDLAKYLLECGASINQKNQGKTPLEWAIFWGNMQAMKTLINAGANINAENSRKETPLLQCVWESQVGMVHFLIKNKVNVRNVFKYQSIRYIKDREVADILIGAGAVIDVNGYDEEKLLFEYASGPRADMLQFLVDNGADVNTRDKDGNAPIHFANHREIMEILIACGADINAKDRYGVTPLIQHVKKANTEMVQFLIDKRADANARDKDGNAPIHHASGKAMMKILINAGADINAKDRYGVTPLIQHVKESNIDIVQFLVDKGADANARDKDRNVSIYFAKDVGTVKILIDAGADINAKNKYGETPLIQHAKKVNTEAVQFLIDKGADVNAGDQYGKAPVHYTDDKGIMEILINAGADINAKDRYGVTPLIQHVKRAYTEMVQFLIKKGADVDARDKDGKTSIHYANGKEIMEILDNSDAISNIGNEGETVLLFQYVIESNIEMAQSLVEKGKNVSARDKYGNTPIHYTNNREMIEILINAGADINAKGAFGVTPLIQNVKESNMEITQFLIDKGANVNARNRYGNVPIHYTDDIEIVEILINAGADINAKNKYGITPLIQSVRESDIVMVWFLVDKGADVNARDKNGNTPIHFAKDVGTIEILIDAGAGINAKK